MLLTFFFQNKNMTFGVFFELLFMFSLNTDLRVYQVRF